MRNLIGISVLLFFFYPLFGQPIKGNSFQLTVELNKPSSIDSIELGIVFPGFIKNAKLRSGVNQGKAIFTGTLSNSVMAFLYSSDGRTSEFLLEPGKQTIVIDGLFVGGIPRISSMNNITLARYIETIVNPVHEYYQKNFDNANSNQTSKRDSLFQILIKSYKSNKLNSTLFLWEAYLLLGRYGYSKEIDSILKRLHRNTKDCALFDIVQARLNSTKSVFILNQLQDVSNQLLCESNQDTAVIAKRFTLYKFWYAACGPCRVAFRDIARDPDILLNKNLEIVAIQVDNQKAFEDGSKWLRDQGLKIRNYWDANGIFIKRLSVVKFPTTFLVDNQEKKVSRDPALADLKNIVIDF